MQHSGGGGLKHDTVGLKGWYIRIPWNSSLIVAPKTSPRTPMDVGWHQDRAIQLRQLGFVLACIRCGDLAVRVGCGPVEIWFSEFL